MHNRRRPATPRGARRPASDFELEPGPEIDPRLVSLDQVPAALQEDPPPMRSGAGAYLEMIGRRALAVLRHFGASEAVEIYPDDPTPMRSGKYAISALEAELIECWDGVTRDALVVTPSPYGYDRSGTVGTEAFEVGTVSNIVNNAAGRPVFSAACATVQAFAASTKVITSELLFSRFRVRNPYLSRVVIKVAKLSGTGTRIVGSVKVWIAKGQPTEINRVTRVARIQQRFVTGTPRTFNIAFYGLLSIVDESGGACPLPTDDDTYYLCIQTDEGLSCEVTTRTDGTEHFPFFELYTLLGSSTGGSGPGGLPATAVREQTVVKYFLQKPTVPGAAPANVFVLADGTFASAGAFPAPIAAGDAGADSTGGAAPGSPLQQDFWYIPPYPLILPRGHMKVKIRFTPGGGNSVSQIDVSVLKNTGAGTAVLFTRTFAGLALVALSEFVIPVALTGDTTFNIGDFLGIRIKLTHNNVGTLTIDHLRGSDQSHAEAAISA